MKEKVDEICLYKASRGVLFCLASFLLHFAVSLYLYSTWLSSTVINIGSYMSAHVLLILLNELGKRDKMRGLPSILSLFRNDFNKINNTRARM